VVTSTTALVVVGRIEELSALAFELTESKEILEVAPQEAKEDKVSKDKVRMVVAFEIDFFIYFPPEKILIFAL
jgi:hypothetical protein